MPYKIKKQCYGKGFERNDSTNNVGSQAPSRLWRREPTKGSEKGAEHSDFRL
jgi:hypothetical protein